MSEEPKSKLKLFRIEGQEYVAESADSAYAQHMRGWHNIPELDGGFPPLVTVLEKRKATGADIGTALHRMLELEGVKVPEGWNLRSYQQKALLEWKTDYDTKQSQFYGEPRTGKPRDTPVEELTEYERAEGRTHREGQHVEDPIILDEATRLEPLFVGLLQGLCDEGYNYEMAKAALSEWERLDNERNHRVTELVEKNLEQAKKLAAKRFISTETGQNILPEKEYEALAEMRQAVRDLSEEFNIPAGTYAGGVRFLAEQLRELKARDEGREKSINNYSKLVSVVAQLAAGGAPEEGNALEILYSIRNVFKIHGYLKTRVQIARGRG